MRRPYQFLYPLLSLFLVRVDLTDFWPVTYQAQVLKIIDGDTVLIQVGRHPFKLRLSRVDAPEKDQPFLNSHEKAGLYSWKCAQKVIQEESHYELHFEKKDIYGRLLGDLNHVSLKLVERGCMGLYPYAIFSSRQEKSLYLRALQKARQERRGVWKWGGYRQPKLWRKEFNRRFAHQQ